MLFIVSVILILYSTSFARPISIDQHTEYKSEYVQSVATTVHILHLHPQGIVAKLGSADRLKPISYFIADDTVAAINASFFTHSANAIGSIKQSNQPLFISTKRRGVIGWRNSPQGVQWYFDRLALDKRGVVVSDFHDTSWWQQVDYLFEGAPLLLFNGEKQAYLVEGLNNDFVFRRYARSAICVLPSKDFVFFLVED